MTIALSLTRAVLALAAGGLCAAASATTVYSNDFDAAPVVAPGVGDTLVLADAGIVPTISPYAATYGNILRNSTTGLTELTLSGLGAHSAVDVGFTMAFLDSWDSTDGAPAPDWLNLYIDGTLVASYTYNNASGGVTAIGGGTLVAAYTQFDGNVFYSDTVVDMSADPGLVFAHTGSTLKIGFQAGGAGWQGGSDEAWGIDNLTVSVSAVPEPASVALMLAGLAVTAGAARRRHR